MSNKITINVDLNGTLYPISCEEEDKNRLIKSSEEVNKVIKELSDFSESVGENRLLAMASILLADKLIDKTDTLKKNSSLESFNSDKQQLFELVDWIKKATVRMNNIAKLIQNS
jgi:cell division protein ZapA (FtsZ GTPase activity inhibitor)